MQFAVRVEVSLTNCKETSFLKLRDYDTCKLQQSSLVKRMVSVKLSMLLKPVIEGGINGSFVNPQDTRGNMLLRAGIR
jgi:hypothetical protein